MNNKLMSIVWLKIGDELWNKFAAHIFQSVRTSLDVELYEELNLNVLDFRGVSSEHLRTYIQNKLKENYE